MGISHFKSNRLCIKCVKWTQQESISDSVLLSSYFNKDTLLVVDHGDYAFISTFNKKTNQIEVMVRSGKLPLEIKGIMSLYNFKDFLFKNPEVLIHHVSIKDVSSVVESLAVN